MSPVAKLPELPLPDIITTLEKYVEFLEPLDSVNSKEESIKFVCNVLKCLKNGNKDSLSQWHGAASYFIFLESIARAYKQFCNSSLHTSHVAPWWNAMYLGNRDPLPFGWNYMLHFDGKSITTHCQRLNISPQALRASIIGTTSLYIRSFLDRPSFFTPEVQQLLPKECRVELNLCRDQYTRLFRTVRIPHAGMDGLRWSYPGKVLLLCKGYPFVVNWTCTYATGDVGDFCSKKWLEEVVVNAHLIDAIIHKTASLPVNKTSPLVLASGCRRQWAYFFESELWSEKVSKAALEDITSSCFAICLDYKSDILSALSGGNLIENRYPDINVMYIVNPLAEVYCNIEHSWGDGSIMRFVSGVMNHYTEYFLKDDHNWIEITRNCTAQVPETCVRPLRFGALSSELLDAIAETRRVYEQKAAMFGHTVRRISKFGTDDIKKNCKCSPEAFVHSAFHLAQRRLFGDQRSTYCAMMTRHYNYGRTEGLRTVTHATQKMADAVELAKETKGFNSKVRAALQKASSEHRGRIMACRAGAGPHRAITLMRILHTVVKERLPRITPSQFSYNIFEAVKVVDALFFSSPALLELSTNYLSTSNITAVGISSFSFLPYYQNEIGIGYTLFPNSLTFTFSSYRLCSRPLRGTCRTEGRAGDSDEVDICTLYADIFEKSICDIYRLTAIAPPSRL